MTIWTPRTVPVGASYQYHYDAAAVQGEAVDFGYTALLDTGVLSAPSSVSVILATDYGDSASAITVAGTVTSDTGGYAVTAILPTANTDTMTGDWVYQVKEVRSDSNASYPYGGTLSFSDRVEA